MYIHPGVYTLSLEDAFKKDSLIAPWIPSTNREQGLLCKIGVGFEEKG